MRLENQSADTNDDAGSGEDSASQGSRDDQDNAGQDNAEDAGQDNAEAAKWKALARRHEKESKRLAGRVKTFEDATKSDLDKITERAAKAEERAAAAEHSAMRLEVAVAKQVPAALASRLRGATLEEIEADADELLATIGDRGKTRDLDAGVKSGSARGSAGGNADMNSLIRGATGRGTQ